MNNKDDIVERLKFRSELAASRMHSAERDDDGFAYNDWDYVKHDIDAAAARIAELEAEAGEWSFNMKEAPSDDIWAYYLGYKGRRVVERAWKDSRDGWITGFDDVWGDSPNRIDPIAWKPYSPPKPPAESTP